MSNNPIKDFGKCIVNPKLNEPHKALLPLCFDVFYPQSTNIRTICREFEHVVIYAVFWFSHKKSSPNIGPYIGKNIRKQSVPMVEQQKIVPIAMVRMSKNHRHRIAVTKKNIGIASLSKIDHCSSLLYVFSYLILVE